MGVQHPSDLWPRLRHRVFGRQREPGRSCRACGHRLDDARATERCQECGADPAMRGTFDNRPFNRRAIFLILLVIWSAFIAFCWITMSENLIERVNPREVRAHTIELAVRDTLGVRVWVEVWAHRSEERTGGPDQIGGWTLKATSGHSGALPPGRYFESIDRDIFSAWWREEASLPGDPRADTGPAAEVWNAILAVQGYDFEDVWDRWSQFMPNMTSWEQDALTASTGPYRPRAFADWVFHLIWPALWIVRACVLAMVLRPSGPNATESR